LDIARPNHQIATEAKNKMGNVRKHISTTNGFMGSRSNGTFRTIILLRAIDRFVELGGAEAGAVALLQRSWAAIDRSGADDADAHSGLLRSPFG